MRSQQPPQSISQHPPPSTRTIHDNIAQQNHEYRTKSRQYRHFRDAIQSSLAPFDKSREWADLIKCLKQLSSTLDRYKQIALIPDSVLLQKRLSQCLNPNLPTGVHMKVLEIYEQVFRQVGDQRLALDISIWSGGVFAFLPYASLEAKPTVLQLLETYYLPLPINALSPCMTALICSVLSVLEDDSSGGGSELSNRARQFLDRIRSKVSVVQELETMDYLNMFYQCLWKCVLLTPQYRVSAIGYIIYVIKSWKSQQQRMGMNVSSSLGGGSLMHHSKSQSQLLLTVTNDDNHNNHNNNSSNTLTTTTTTTTTISSSQFPLEILAQNTDLVVSSIVASLHDPSLSAQRAALELLSTQFTFDANLMSKSCYRTLLKNSLLLLCKRDLSVNRRFFQWLFGNAASQFDPEFFAEYSLALLVDSIRSLMSTNKSSGNCKFASDSIGGGDGTNNSSSSNSNNSGGSGGGGDNSPLTVVLLLLQQGDFPVHIQSQIMTSIIESVLFYLHGHLEGPQSQSVVDAFVQLLPLMEPKTIVWDCLLSLLKNANNTSNLVSSENDEQYLQLIDLIGGVFSILYSEKLDHVLLIGLEVELLKFLHDRTRSQKPNVQIIETCLLLCINIFTKIPTRGQNNEGDEYYKSVNEQIYAKVERIFGLFVTKIIFNHGGELDESEKEKRSTVKVSSHSISHYYQFTDVFKSACTFMTILLSTAFQDNQDLPVPTVANIPKFVNYIYKCLLEHDDLQVIIFSIETFLGLLTKSDCGLDARIQQFIIRHSHGFHHLEHIVRRLWSLLSPETALVHFEAVKLLVEIHGLNPKLCNAILSDYMLDSNIDTKVEAHRRFALIWRLIDELGIEARVFDEGMFLMLDSIKSDDSNLRLAGKSWLIASFRKMYRILDPLFQTLIDQEFLRNYESENMATSKRKSLSCVANSPYDQERCKYVLGIWNAMLQVAPRNFIQRAMELQLTDDVQNNFKRHTRKNFYPFVPDQAELAPSSLFNFASNDYYSLIVSTCVQFMECGVFFEPNRPSWTQEEQKYTLSDKTVLEETIRTRSIVLLRDILINGKMFRRTTDFAQALVEVVLLHLRNAVETNDAVFQVEILGILHTLLAHLHAHSAPSSADPQPQNRSILMSSSQSPIVVLVHSPNFLPTLLQGILVANESQINPAFYSYSLLNYWVDYVSSFLPFLETALPFVVTSIVPHFCNIIRDNAQAGIDSLRSQAIQKLLDGLKKVLAYCVLDYSADFVDIDIEAVKHEEPPSSMLSSATSTVTMPFRLITDLVKDVFTHEEVVVKNNQVSPASKAQQFMLSELPVVLETMSIVWKALRSPYSTDKSVTSLQRRGANNLGLVQYGSLHTKYVIEQGIVHFIDPLIEKHRPQLAASLVMFWGNLHPEIYNSIEYVPHELDSHVMDILNNVDSATPENIITSIVDVIVSIRQNRNPKPSSATTSASSGDNSEQSDSQNRMREQVALGFLQVYLKRCILTDKASFILARLLRLIREYVSLPPSATASNNMDLMVISMLLKTLHAFLARWGVQTNDKKIKAKLMEAFHQLFGSGLFCCVRDMNIRQEKHTKNYKNHKLTTAEKERFLREDLHDKTDPTLQFLNMMADNLEDYMEKIPHDYTTTSNLVSVIGSPIILLLKNTTIVNLRRMHCTMKLLSKFNSPMLNMKSMRKELWDLFYTTTFFKVQKETIELWKTVFHTLLNGGETIDQSSVQNDEEVLLFEQQQLIQKENKVLFSDLLGRFNATQSLFTSRETEAHQRANLMKRLGFILYTAGTNDYVSFLPSILEKMVESLRLNSSPMSNNVLVTNVLFCLRILITRMSPSNLTPIWPMVITELLKIFSNVNQWDELGVEPYVILEAVKFIDFALVALPHEFHLFKWMFCTQTSYDSKIQSVFQPYLSQIVNKYLSKEDQASLLSKQDLLETCGGTTMRRPINSDIFSNSWTDVAKLSCVIMSQKRETELYSLSRPNMDHVYMNHRLANDFSELSAQDNARLLSAHFDPSQLLNRVESWIVVSVNHPSTDDLTRLNGETNLDRTSANSTNNNTGGDGDSEDGSSTPDHSTQSTTTSRENNQQPNEQGEENSLVNQEEQ